MALPLSNSRCKAFFELPFERCSQCNNPMGIFKCHGCDKAFCVRHTMEHRNPLRVQLTELRRKDGKLDTDVNVETLQIEGHRLTEQINDWEKQSIEKIRQAAAEARKKVSYIVDASGHSQLKQLLECREVFTARLQQAETDDDYHEGHLEYWSQFLEDLRVNFSRLRSSYVRLEYCTMPFISKIIVHENSLMMLFTEWCYFQRKSTQIVDIRRCEIQQKNCTQSIGIRPCESYYEGSGGQFVGIRPCESYYEGSGGQLAGIRPYESFYQGYSGQVVELTQSTYQAFYTGSARELKTGEYRFRFNTARFFIGIISKSADTRSESLNISSVYGWTGDSVVYVDGVSERGYGGYQSDIKIGDIVSLIVNHEQKLIRLTNKITNKTHELAVNVEKCPLPWLLNVRFFLNDVDE